MRRAALLLVAACGASPTPTSIAPPPPSRAAPSPAANAAPASPPPATSGKNVHGRVILDGQPVPYFGLTYTNDFSFAGVNSEPDLIRTTDGEFVAEVPAGHWDLVIAAPGAARQVIAGVEISGRLDLGTISLWHGHTLTGVVRDDSGAPVPNARVEFLANATDDACNYLCNLTRGNVSTRTDKNGHYELRGVSRGALATHRPELVAKTDDGLASIPIESPDADTSQDLHVSVTGTVVVTVTGGRPMMVVASAPHMRELAHTENGEERFEHLPVGTYEITALSTDRKSYATQNVTVHANRVESVTMALPVPQPVSVEITSTQRDCTDIQIRDFEGNEVALAPCSKRAATFPALAPGDYLACVDRKLCAPLFVDPAPAQQKLNVPR